MCKYIPIIASFTYFFLCFFFSNAQAIVPPEIDSLHTLLAETSQPKTRIDLLNELAYQFLFHDLSQVKVYADSALTLATSISYQKGIGDAQARLGGYFFDRDQPQLAISHYRQCLKIREKEGDPGSVANLYFNLGTLSASTGQQQEAIQYFQKALLIYQSAAEYRVDEAETHNALSEVYLQLNLFEKALLSCQEGWLLLQPGDDSSIRANSLLNLGTIHTQMDKYENAHEEFSRALTLYEQEGNLRGQQKTRLNQAINHSKAENYSQAIRSYQLADSLGVVLSNEEEQFNIRFNLGLLHLRMNEFAQAEPYFLQALSLAEQKHDTSAIVLCWNNLGIWAYDQGNYSKALDYYQNSLRLAPYISERLTKGDVYEGIARTYTGLGKYDSANIYYQLNNLVRDSVLISDRKALELEKQMGIVRAVTLEQQTSDLETSELKSQQKTIVIYSLIGLFLLLASSIYFSLRARTEKQNRVIAGLESEKREIQYQSEIDTLKVLSANALFTGQEKERERLSKELHDQVGALLSSIKWNIDALLEAFSPSPQEVEIDKINRLVEETLTEVRGISHNMTSKRLSKFGLPKALEYFIQGLSTSKANILFHTHNFDQRLDPIQELHLYRIAQEGIINAIKHGEASEINVQLSRFAKRINLLIEDDGEGFDKTHLVEQSGIGLDNIHHRTNLLGGTLELDSVPGTGTTLSIDLPYHS